MTKSLHDALVPLASRMPRVIREHEVLRVAGWIPGDDPARSLESAADQVLRWAQKRCGGRLPPEAWQRQSFDYLSGGRNSSCVRLRSAGTDLWTVRADDPDSNVAERVWTTEVAIGWLPDTPLRFSARLLVSTPEAQLPIEPAVPGLVQQIVDTCGLVVGRTPLAVRPAHYDTPEDGEALIAVLTDPLRALPVFVISLVDGQSSHPTLDTDALAKAVLGLAQVAVLGPAAAWVLTKTLGKVRSVFGGAARVYLPGFSDQSDPFTHRLVLATQLADIQDAARTTTWMRQLAAQDSVLRTRLGRDVLSFAMIRDASLKVRQETLRTEDASPGDQLVAATERIAALTTQRDLLIAEQEYYLSECEAERERAETAEAQVTQAAWRIQNLLELAASRGEDPDGDLEWPAVWADVADWCDRHLAGRLVLTPVARRGLRRPVFADVELAARGLFWLATTARDRFRTGGGALSNIHMLEGLENAPCGTDAYDFDWTGRRFSANWHVVDGGRTRDPVRCLRIYYCFDGQTQQIVVSDMPAHRRSGAT